MPRINASNISAERRADLATILIVCGYTVRFVKEKKNANSNMYIQYVEYEDGQGAKV